MNANERIPMLTWRNRDGGYTAGLIADWDNTAAVAETLRDAQQQLKDFLDWHWEEYGFVEGGDLRDLELSVHKVEIRPEYTRGDRAFPCEETVRLRVPCVTGVEEGGMAFCSIPTMAVRFNFHDKRALKGLVSHFVKNALKGSSPASLARRFPPEETRLDHIVFRGRPESGDKGRPWFERPEFETLRSVAEPFLSGRGRTQRFGAAWGRASETAELIHRLGSGKANIILLGPPGCGKTALLAEAVKKLSAEKTGDAEAELRRFRFWLTNGARLIAGMKYLGQWEERCEAVIDELSDVAGVLCAENLLDLVHSGGAGPGDSLAAFLLPYLQQGELQLVAEATPAELDACRRLFPAFSDAFQILRLEEFDDASALKALEKVIASRERQTSVEAEHGSAPLIHRLFRRFVPYAAFPGKAVKFLNDAFESCVESGDRTLTHDLLLRRFVDHTGLPELFLRDELPLDYNEALARFNDRIIGQPEACRRATDVITTFKAGMNDASRPVATLLFSGPTGVGKTALARAMAECLFGGTATPPPESPAREMERLIRLDMSEYSLPGSAARLLTGNDGGPSEFIKRVRRQPFVVVLLDEIEKAAPEIFDVFLNVFDEGRLTDRLGRETLFRSAVIVMTSNLGASGSGGLGFGPQSPPSYDDEAMRFFRPEFFNRIDSVVAFAPLERDSILQIAEKELRDLGRREGFTAANLQLVWADKLIAHLADIGFDLKLGARPLQRAIEHEVIAPLARFLVARPGLRDRRIRLNWSSGSGLDLSAD